MPRSLDAGRLRHVEPDRRVRWHCTWRQRPFESRDGITARTTVPDTFGAPGGHRLHPVAFAQLRS